MSTTIVCPSCGLTRRYRNEFAQISQLRCTACNSRFFVNDEGEEIPAPNQSTHDSRNSAKPRTPDTATASAPSTSAKNRSQSESASAKNRSQSESASAKNRSQSESSHSTERKPAAQSPRANSNADENSIQTQLKSMILPLSLAAVVAFGLSVLAGWQFFGPVAKPNLSIALTSPNDSIPQPSIPLGINPPNPERPTEPPVNRVNPANPPEKMGNPGNLGVPAIPPGQGTPVVSDMLNESKQYPWATFGLNSRPAYLPDLEFNRPDPTRRVGKPTRSFVLPSKATELVATQDSLIALESQRSVINQYTFEGRLLTRMHLPQNHVAHSLRIAPDGMWVWAIRAPKLTGGVNIANDEIIRLNLMTKRWEHISAGKPIRSFVPLQGNDFVALIQEPDNRHKIGMGRIQGETVQWGPITGQLPDGQLVLDSRRNRMTFIGGGETETIIGQFEFEGFGLVHSRDKAVRVFTSRYDPGHEVRIGGDGNYFATQAATFTWDLSKQSPIQTHRPLLLSADLAISSTTVRPLASSAAAQYFANAISLATIAPDGSGFWAMNLLDTRVQFYPFVPQQLAEDPIPNRITDTLAMNTPPKTPPMPTVEPAPKPPTPTPTPMPMPIQPTPTPMPAPTPMPMQPKPPTIPTRPTRPSANGTQLVLPVRKSPIPERPAAPISEFTRVGDATETVKSTGRIEEFVILEDPKWAFLLVDAGDHLEQIDRSTQKQLSTHRQKNESFFELQASPDQKTVWALSGLADGPPSRRTANSLHRLIVSENRWVQHTLDQPIVRLATVDANHAVVMLRDTQNSTQYQFAVLEIVNGRVELGPRVGPVSAGNLARDHTGATVYYVGGATSRMIVRMHTEERQLVRNRTDEIIAQPISTISRSSLAKLQVSTDGKTLALGTRLFEFDNPNASSNIPTTFIGITPKLAFTNTEVFQLPTMQRVQLFQSSLRQVVPASDGKGIWATTTFTNQSGSVVAYFPFVATDKAPAQLKSIATDAPRNDSPMASNSGVNPRPNPPIRPMNPNIPNPGMPGGPFPGGPLPGGPFPGGPLPGGMPGMPGMPPILANLIGPLQSIQLPKDPSVAIPKMPLPTANGKQIKLTPVHSIPWNGPGDGRIVVSMSQKRIVAMRGNSQVILVDFEGKTVGNWNAESGKVFRDVQLDPTGKYAFVWENDTVDNPFVLLQLPPDKLITNWRRIDLTTGQSSSGKSIGSAASFAVVDAEHLLTVELTPKREFQLATWKWGEKLTPISQVPSVRAGRVVYHAESKRVFYLPIRPGPQVPQEWVNLVCVGGELCSGPESGYHTTHTAGMTPPITPISSDGTRLYVDTKQIEPHQPDKKDLFFPEPIVAASRDLAFSRSGYWDVTTGKPLGNWSGRMPDRSIGTDGKFVWVLDVMQGKMVIREIGE
ncbi:atrophin-1 family protein [Tuwongella immobilis]|uniref:---NA n=1 Tax=Tuwongella immobilis TaxID=692036 RepID=A0A6C2YW99_9BACT|nr:hypothetical protein [Tuwongella immobilis]VIP05734.1 ---NA--- : [Tuwongella immobilis]VTS08824.1 ---NA--- : [Tuwongella immobilis]